jgi:Zn-dependent protease
MATEVSARFIHMSDQTANPGRPRRRGIFGVLAAAAAMVKFAPLLKFGAFASKGKAALGMIASIWVYALFWGWKFAVGFVLLIFIHELGHAAALRFQGVKASLPMFIPFVGAFIKVEGRQRDVAQEAWSAIAGPAVGLAASFALFNMAGGDQFLTALSYTGFFLNLFNLAPVLPLDGGRVAGAISPKIWLYGMGVAVVWLVLNPIPILFLILLLGGLETVQRWKTRHEESAYLQIDPSARKLIGVAYLFLIVVALLGMNAAHVDPTSLQR